VLAFSHLVQERIRQALLYFGVDFSGLVKAFVAEALYGLEGPHYIISVAARTISCLASLDTALDWSHNNYWVG
jgi:hypothetical protein